MRWDNSSRWWRWVWCCLSSKLTQVSSHRYTARNKKELNLLNTFQFQSTISSLLIVSVDDAVVPLLFRFVKQSSSSVITTLLFVISWRGWLLLSLWRWWSNCISSCSLFKRWLSEDVCDSNEPTSWAFSQTLSVTLAYWQFDKPPELERETGEMDDDWVE